MAITVRLQLLVLFLIFLLISLFVSAATAQSSFSSAAPAPSTTVFNTQAYPPTMFATILSTLGFNELSTATATSNLSASTPLTIFAPSDSSLLTCSSCSLPSLIHELSLPGVYPYHYLQSLIFGTKIETLAPYRCLTVTNNAKGEVFINGVQISKPDLFNNGIVAIHGLSGYVSHLSPFSCNVERMSSLSFPSASQPRLSIMRLMLKDAIARLQVSGYSVVSLALRVKYAELMELRSMTIFALDDMAIFNGGGNAYLSHFRFHVVPNRRLTAAELVGLPATTVLVTLDVGNNLIVTTAGGGGILAPMKINFVKVTTIDLMHNSRIVVHAISSPFPRMHHHLHDAYGATSDQSYQGISAGAAEAYQGTTTTTTTTRPAGIGNCDHYDWSRGVCVVEAELPAGTQPLVDAEDHHGL